MSKIVDAVQIKNHRLRLGMSQAEFGLYTETSKRTIIRMEAGESVAVSSIRKVAQTVGVADWTRLVFRASDPKPESATVNKYARKFMPRDDHAYDVYDVLIAFGVTCPAVAHAVKKLLMAGERGHKDRKTDLREAIAAIERAIELESK